MFIADTVKHGKECIFQGDVTIYDNVEIGNNVFIGCNTIINSGCRIGDNTVIMSGCHLSSNTHIDCETLIGTHCSIGANISIGKKVNIGHNCSIFKSIDLLFNNKGNDARGICGGDSIGDNCIIQPQVVLECGIDKPTTIGNRTAIGVSSYIKSEATLKDDIRVGAFCVIGEGSIIEDWVWLFSHTIVGSYAHLHKGVKGINGCIFDAGKEYHYEDTGRGWFLGEFALPVPLYRRIKQEIRSRVYKKDNEQKQPK